MIQVTYLYARFYTGAYRILRVDPAKFRIGTFGCPRAQAPLMGIYRGILITLTLTPEGEMREERTILRDETVYGFPRRLPRLSGAAACQGAPYELRTGDYFESWRHVSVPPVAERCSCYTAWPSKKKPRLPVPEIPLQGEPRGGDA